MAVLAFSKTWEGQPTGFKEKIQQGQKKHTFRGNFKRSSGEIIDFWDNSPRNPSKKPQPFEIPTAAADIWQTVERIKEGQKVKIQRPLIYAIEKYEFSFYKNQTFTLTIGDLFIDNQHFLNLVAFNDGFDHPTAFVRWFWLQSQKKKTPILEGQIIHWTASTVYDADTAEIFKPLPY